MIEKSRLLQTTRPDPLPAAREQLAEAERQLAQAQERVEYARGLVARLLDKEHDNG